MAYWWVNQNQTYIEEREGGLLWAPLKDRGGKTPHHWARMNDLLPGDIVFSYVGQAIVAFSYISTAAHPSARPHPSKPGLEWQDEGLRANARYCDLNPPIQLNRFATDILPILPKIYSPLDLNGEGNQGYLYPLPPNAAHRITREIADFSIRIETALLNDLTVAVDQRTIRESLVLCRVGQGKFRKEVLRVWNQRCCVTGLTIESLLKASHIKPWADSNDDERLDPYNGLLLSPSYDAAFDAGLLTFEDDGRVDFSNLLSETDIRLLGLECNVQIEGLTPKHRSFLKHHRDYMFRR